MERISNRYLQYAIHKVKKVKLGKVCNGGSEILSVMYVLFAMPIANFFSLKQLYFVSGFKFFFGSKI